MGRRGRTTRNGYLRRGEGPLAVVIGLGASRRSRGSNEIVGAGAGRSPWQEMIGSERTFHSKRRPCRAQGALRYPDCPPCNKTFQGDSREWRARRARAPQAERVSTGQGAPCAAERATVRQGAACDAERAAARRGSQSVITITFLIMERQRNQLSVKRVLSDADLIYRNNTQI